VPVRFVWSETPGYLYRVFVRAGSNAGLGGVMPPSLQTSLWCWHYYLQCLHFCWNVRAGLIDEMRFAISPVLLGGCERLFGTTDVRAPGYYCVQFAASESAAHTVLWRQAYNEV
jgi:hypothetical protein